MHHKAHGDSLEKRAKTLVRNDDCRSLYFATMEKNHRDPGRDMAKSAGLNIFQKNSDTIFILVLVQTSDPGFI